MSVRHIITLEKDGKEIYSTQILGSNDFFGKDFKYYVKNDDWLDKTEIDLKYLIIYWRKWLEKERRNKVTTTKELLKYNDDDFLIVLDTVLSQYYILQPFSFMKDLQKLDCYYDSDITLKDGYKLYLEVC